MKHWIKNNDINHPIRQNRMGQNIYDNGKVDICKIDEGVYNKLASLQTSQLIYSLLTTTIPNRNSLKILCVSKYSLINFSLLSVVGRVFFQDLKWGFVI